VLSVASLSTYPRATRARTTPRAPGEKIWLRGLSSEQNPCFRQRYLEFNRPGELLNQDTFFVGHLKGVGKPICTRWISTVAFFGFLHISKQSEAAVTVLHNEARPFYAKRSLRVENVPTDKAGSPAKARATPPDLPGPK
jgi:hypothetical protein